MPTHAEAGIFIRDFNKLTKSQRDRFLAALENFIADLLAIEAGQRKSFRSSLRVRKVQGLRGVFEMTWANDGRATFSWGDEVIKGRRHVEWRRCGSHDIFKRP